MEPKNTPQAKTALEFAAALTAGDYQAAHQLLAISLRAEMDPRALQTEYESMIDYGDGQAFFFDVMQVLQDWPTKKAGDVGWAYVAIAGPEFSEAVAVVVADDGGKHRIREIEWGRP